METGSPEYVRRINRALVLDQVRKRGSLSRARLSKLLKLSKMTVSTIVSELFEEQLLTEVGTGPTGANGGRKPILFSLSPASRYVAGVDIGKTNTTVALANIKGEVLHKLREPTCPETTVANIIAQVQNLIQEVATRSNVTGSAIAGIGVSLPGVIKADEGVVQFSPGLKWKNVRFRDLLAQASGHRVVIDNCTRAMALAEKRYGCAQEQRNVLLVNVGYGIGSALIMDGNVCHHHSEFGHVYVTKERVMCHCGNYGCLETVASGRAIEMAAKARLTQKTSSPLTAKTVAEMAYDGDPEAIEIFRQAGRYLGRAISIVANVFTPQQVVIGGGVSLAGDLLLQPVIAEFNEHAMPIVRDEAAIVLSSLGMDSGVLGAVALALDEFVFDTKVISHIALS